MESVCECKADSIILCRQVISEGTCNTWDRINIDTSLTEVTQWTCINVSVGCKTTNTFIRASVAALTWQTIIQLALVLVGLISTLWTWFRDL